MTSLHSRDRRFSEHEIADALDETIAEVAREPRTDLRRAFWDRLTEGHTPPQTDAEYDERDGHA